MPKMLLSQADLRQVLQKRRLSGADRYDEVWNETYVMSPIADNDHQRLVGGFVFAFAEAVESLVLPGANVTDRAEDWTKNFRCPDVLVFLPGNLARDCGTHWLGGPDFAVEILSRGDRSRKKFAFYASVGVRELLLVSRFPWRLELYRLHDGTLESAGTATADDGIVLRSAVLPLTFHLVPAESRPRVEFAEANGPRRWSM